MSRLSRTRIVALALLVAVLLGLALARWLPSASQAGLPTLPRLEQQIGSLAHDLPWWIGLVLVWLVACLLLAARRH